MTIFRKTTYLVFSMALVSGLTNCNAQNKKDMEQHNNPLLCNPDSGICELPGGQNHEPVRLKSTEKPVKVIYFTDPICSSCWGIEPQLRKLKLEFGNTIEIDYRMGGLLPDWSYNSGGISKPSDVAHHWDEVSVYYDMPIDGDLWMEDPLSSSYPPSIAFKAAQLQDKNKAILFLREIREMVFLKKKNITKWEYLEQAAKKAGLDIPQFKSDYEGKAIDLFKKDLELAREMNVRGFPTLFFADRNGKIEKVYGSQPYAAYENAILTLSPEAKRNEYSKNPESVFSYYHSLSAKEFSELSGVPRDQAETALNELVTKGFLEKLVTKNGGLWVRKGVK